MTVLLASVCENQLRGRERNGKRWLKVVNFLVALPFVRVCADTSETVSYARRPRKIEIKHTKNYLNLTTIIIQDIFFNDTMNNAVCG